MTTRKDNDGFNWRYAVIAFLLIIIVVMVVLIINGPMIGQVFSEIGVNSFNGSANTVVTLPTSGVVAGEERDAAAPPVDMFFEDYGINPITDTRQDHLSTFAMDVDTASYTLARSYLLEYRMMPEAAAIRPEEFINYFPVEYPQPTGDDAFAIQMNAAPAPFGHQGQVLLRVGIQGRSVAPEDRLPALLIFVIDTSGSMDQTNRLQLAKESLQILTSQLREDDRVAIVVYSDETRVVLPPTPASEQDRIVRAIQLLTPSGSTYAEAGLNLGYEVALQNMRPDTLTRVILVSDGVANVGATGPAAILETVQRGVEQGITLTTLGFGMGNYNDVLMEQLANDGNGSYFYIDNLREAERVFVHNLTSTLQTIGYDARIQVNFNPDVVAAYRLIGYENRAIADDQFRNDAIDAGEVGAGHTVTALYELDLINAARSGIMATASLRYEDADSRQVREISRSIDASEIVANYQDTPQDFQLQAIVAEFSEILHESPFSIDDDFTVVAAMLDNIAVTDDRISEFRRMVKAAQQIH